MQFVSLELLQYVMLVLLIVVEFSVPLVVVELVVLEVSPTSFANIF